MNTFPGLDRAALRSAPVMAELFRRFRLLLFWPLFGLLFGLAERPPVPRAYITVHCALDDLIPFCELFVIPYVFWFVFMLGMHVYTFFRDGDAFRRMMRFIILTYSAALVVFLFFPTVQHLRPMVFPRDNLLTRFMAGFYAFDTNTNVCPSLHVVGSVAVLFASWDTPRFRSRPWRMAFGVTTLLICASTVFLKQHSVIDVAVGLLFCVGGYILVYQNRNIRLPSSDPALLAAGGWRVEGTNWKNFYPRKG